MGAEAVCTARFKKTRTSGKARLETEVLHFRGGDLRLAIPFKQMRAITARGGTLTVVGPDGRVAFDLGPAAAKWADKIQHPPSRLQKLGAKPEWRASAIGLDDAAFLLTFPLDRVAPTANSNCSSAPMASTGNRARRCHRSRP